MIKFWASHRSNQHAAVFKAYLDNMLVERISKKFKHLGAIRNSNHNGQHATSTSMLLKIKGKWPACCFRKEDAEK